MLLPVIQAAVDDRVVHGGAHGEPHDSQVDLLDEGLLEEQREELMKEKVDVVRQPADGEGTHDHDHHLHHLHTKKGEGVKQSGQTRGVSSAIYLRRISEGVKESQI